MQSGLILTIDKGVARLKLSRPETRNALTRDICTALCTAVAGIKDNPTCRIVVIEGSGGAFASGADVAELDRLRRDRSELLAFYRGLRATQELVYALDRITIAAIDGYCIGAGLSLALACDFRIATPRSVFAAPPAKLGLLYSEMEVSRLTNHVGCAHARDLLFTGRRITAANALRIGLVGQLTASEDCESALGVLVGQLGECSPVALRKTKAQLLRLERAGIVGIHAHQEVEEAFFEADAAEGIRAFLERRPPQFPA